MDNKDKKRGLGRGLSALMADVAETEQVAAKGVGAAEQMVPIEKIAPNPDQPRKRFEQGDLDDLAASIKKKGVIQPLIVRAREGGNFEIVAGERRWRAAQRQSEGARFRRLLLACRSNDPARSYNAYLKWVSGVGAPAPAALREPTLVGELQRVQTALVQGEPGWRGAALASALQALALDGSFKTPA